MSITLNHKFVLVNVVVAVLFATSIVHAAPPKPRIELELGFEKGAPIDAQQRWFKILTERGVTGLRIRQQEPGEQPSLVAGGTKDAPSYRVLGTITTGSVLIVPGGNFGPNDSAALDKWLKELGENGVQGVTEKKTAFGLTPKQFADVHEDLSRKVDFTTKGLAPKAVLSKLAGQLTTPFTVEESAKKSLAEGDAVREEFEGLSSGTTMAAILRPAGLVMIPRKPTGNPVEFYVTSGKDVKEFWPIGWPPEKLVKDLVPIYFEFLNIEIDDITSEEAIAALHERIKIPFVYDYNGMARAKIDLTKSKIKVPEKKTYYLKALQHVLQQSNLKHETRVDEAGTPFEWITPFRGG